MQINIRSQFEVDSAAKAVHMTRNQSISYKLKNTKVNLLSLWKIALPPGATLTPLTKIFPFADQGNTT